MSRFLAIDADFGAVHVASGTIRAGLARLEKAISIPVREMLSPANAVELGHQVRDALKAAGIAPAPTLATVGRDKVIVKDVKIPRVTPAEEPGVVRFQASKEMSEAPDSIVLDYFTLDRPDPDGQVRVVTASVRKDLLAAYKSLCQAAGCAYRPVHGSSASPRTGRARRRVGARPPGVFLVLASRSPHPPP